MRVKQVAFGYTKNLGNYQSMRVDAVVEVGEGEDFDEALILASAVVHEALDLPVDPAQAQMLTLARKSQVQLAREDK